MNKIGLCLMILFLMLSCGCVKKTDESLFYLDEEYYHNNAVTEIKMNDLKQLQSEAKSFAVFIYQPMCAASNDFETVLQAFTKEQQLRIYKLPFSEIKGTSLENDILYYPSFVIYHQGNMKAFLDANSDDDLPYYRSKEGFQQWFTQYVNLQNASTQKENDTKLSEDHNQNHTESIRREPNKVNIYFFWGNGCPHCAEEFAFFKQIEKQYGAYYQLYSFETWENEANAKLLTQFAKAMNESVSGVPYTVIGQESVIGFGEESKAEILRLIKSQHINGYDIYLDQMKKDR